MGKSSTSFKPGEGGRPFGAKNKNYANASFWLGLAKDEVEKMDDPEKRLTTIKWATELCMSKVGTLPATPGESVSNAEGAFNLMNNIAPINPPLKPNPHLPNANGGTPVNGA